MLIQPSIKSSSPWYDRGAIKVVRHTANVVTSSSYVLINEIYTVPSNRIAVCEGVDINYKCSAFTQSEDARIYVNNGGTPESGDETYWQTIFDVGAVDVYYLYKDICRGMVLNEGESLQAFAKRGNFNTLIFRTTALFTEFDV